jgi:hypothetical protein
VFRRRQQEQPDIGPLVLDPLGGGNPLVGEGRRHADVEDAHVGAQPGELACDLVGAADVA